MRTHLDLNNEKVRRDVVCRLKMMGYDEDWNVGTRTIQAIIREIQFNNQLVADGLIGKDTMPLLGYSEEDIKTMLNIPDENVKYFTVWDCLHALFS